MMLPLAGLLNLSSAHLFMIPANIGAPGAVHRSLRAVVQRASVGSVPLLVLDPGSARHPPEDALISSPSVPFTQVSAAGLVHDQSAIRVPKAARQRPCTRMVPSEATNQCCVAPRLQPVSCTRTPFAVRLPGSVRHRFPRPS